MLEGSQQAKILIIVDKPGHQEVAEHNVLAGNRRSSLFYHFMQAGLHETDLALCFIDDIEIIHNHPANILMPMGDASLKRLTGLQSVDKWHCSVIPATTEFGGRKCLPLLAADRVMKAYEDSIYWQLAASKAIEQQNFPGLEIPAREFIINAGLEETLNFLHEAQYANEIALDLETSCGQINTFGVAISPTKAMAIRIDRGYHTSDTEIKLWQGINNLLTSAVPVVAQNHIYESTFLSAYGIWVNNFSWDTMWASKFLYPELEMGLHNVGRIWTPFPYWKDDNKDWSSIQDWPKHLTYNCCDTTGTLWAAQEQRKDMKAKGLDDKFKTLCLDNMEIIRRMCSRGMLLDSKAHAEISRQVIESIENSTRIIDTYWKEKLDRTVNIRSPKQLKQALKDCGMKIPIGKKGTETTDKTAIVKLRKKYPKEDVLAHIAKLAKDNKKQSSYVDFAHTPDNYVRYQLNGVATETGRWAGYSDPWGNGFNPQTVPKYARKMFQASPNHTLVQIDLSQAESRYVAYEAVDIRLMEMLKRGEDVHTFVASKISGKHPSMISKNSKERQLGKKAGHSSNYGTGPRTFAESCLVDLDLVISEAEAKRILAAYFEVFPGIRARQYDIQKVIRSTRKLVTPLGRQRDFFGYINDKAFREAYAYCPQSTIPDVVNFLMRYLYNNFEDAKFLLQMHDSILLEVEEGRQFEIAEAARDYKNWHPTITLKGGKLVIPVDIEVGSHWEPMEKML